jgi:hypothetical protein
VDPTTRIGFGIMLGLLLSAVAVVLAVAFGAPIWAGLLGLAAADAAVIGWGYTAIQRINRTSDET